MAAAGVVCRRYLRCVRPAQVDQALSRLVQAHRRPLQIQRHRFIAHRPCQESYQSDLRRLQQRDGRRFGALTSLLASAASRLDARGAAGARVVGPVPTVVSGADAYTRNVPTFETHITHLLI